MGIGNKIHERRKELGLTLQNVGDACGVTKSTVRKWETGFIANMRRDKLSLLANVLCVPIEFLLEEEEQNKRDEMEEYLSILRERPEMRLLFSVSKKVSKEDIERFVRMIEAFKE